MGSAPLIVASPVPRIKPHCPGPGVTDPDRARSATAPGSRGSDTEDDAARWAEVVEASNRPGVVDVVLAYKTVGVHADPDRIDLDDLCETLRTLEPAGGSAREGRLIRIPVLYDGEDLADVARRTNLAEGDVIAAHSGQDYRVFALGFLPGFPYAGYLPPGLSGLTRRESPRTRVAAGSVAIVGRQTAIYPQESPGGWHLIGRTPLTIVDLKAARFPIRGGDSLRFVPIGRDEFEAREGEDL